MFIQKVFLAMKTPCYVTTLCGKSDWKELLCPPFRIFPPKKHLSNYIKVSLPLGKLSGCKPRKPYINPNNMWRCCWFHGKPDWKELWCPLSEYILPKNYPLFNQFQISAWGMNQVSTDSLQHILAHVILFYLTLYIPNSLLFILGAYILFWSRHILNVISI